MMGKKNNLSIQQQEDLFKTLETRFEKNKERHPDIEWSDVLERLTNNTNKLGSLHDMELTGGEPDVVGYNKKTNQYIFYDCSKESPTGRRSVCYDREGMESRKQHKPKNNAMDMSTVMGIDLLTEEQYKHLQTFGEFDTKTSSWLKTPSGIRQLGGAIFGDFRYGKVFVYHNGAPSYYAARGFRGVLTI